MTKLRVEIPAPCKYNQELASALNIEDCVVISAPDIVRGNKRSREEGK